MATHSGALAWKNPMDGEAWWAAVHGVAKSWTRLSDFTSLHFLPMQQGYCNSTADAEILAFCTGAELNRRDRVLVEIEKNSSIALPGKWGYCRLMASKLCAPIQGDLLRSFIATVGLLIRTRECTGSVLLYSGLRWSPNELLWFL